MKKFLKTDEWNIIEEGFHADNLRASESIFSLGNGRLGQRGNFEETYSSDSLQGSYVAGISFLDRTRVGWWKNGYPHFFSRIPNAPNWSGIHLRLIDEEVDLAQWDVDSFERRLDMKKGISYRDFEVTSPKGNTLKIHVEHINSMAHQNLCLIKYSVTSVNYEGKISAVPYINGDVKHENSNFNEKMWNILRAETTNEYAYLWTQTKREDSQVCCAMTYQVFKNSKELSISPIKIEKEKLTGFSAGADVKPGERITLIKYTTILSSLYYDRQELVEHAVAESKEAKHRDGKNSCKTTKMYGSISGMRQMSPLKAIRKHSKASVSIFSSSVKATVETIRVSTSVRKDLQARNTEVTPNGTQNFAAYRSSYCPAPKRLPRICCSIAIINCRKLLTMPGN